MKVFLAVLLGLAALTAAGTSSETCQKLKNRVMRRVKGEARRKSFVHKARSLRGFSSCDADGDLALEEAEFAGCLHPFVRDSSKLSTDGLRARLDCFHLFIKEADKNGDLKVSKGEFDHWTRLGFFDIVLTSSEEGVLDAEVGITSNSVVVDTSDIVLTPRQESVLTFIISALQNDNVVQAIVFLYDLLTDSDTSGLSSALIQSFSQLLTSISEGNIVAAVGQAITIVATALSNGGEQVISVTDSTTEALTALVTAVIDNNTEEIINQLFFAVSGVLADFTALTIDSTTAIAAIIRTIIEGNINNISVDQVARIVAVIVAEVTGVTEEARFALLAIVDAIRDEDYDGIVDNIQIALSGILGAVTEVGSETAITLSKIVRAVIESNSENAVLSTAQLYTLLTDGEGSCRGRSRIRIIGN